MTIDPRYRAAEARLWRSLGVEPGESRVPLSALGTSVRVQQLGDGPPLLFVHGGSTSGTSWADLAAALPDRRCLLLDRPGTGLSETPRAVPDIAELAAMADRLIPDVLDGLDIGDVDVVATSFGGWFALRAALAAPGRIRRLVMFGWTAGAPVGRLPFMLRLGVAPIAGSLMDRLPVTTAAVRAIFRGIGSGAAIDDGRITPEAIDAYAALLRWTPTLRNDRRLGGLFFSATGMDERIVLPAADRARIHQPVRWLWGANDAFGGERIARSFVEPFPDVTLEVAPGVGHAPWVDDLPRSVDFVRRALAPAPAPA
jgi:2-hydroxy-6-oxonona-2,4-dienedioate hydrolase